MGEQALNVLFVGEVEKHEILYNYQLPGYSKKDEVEKAWTEVGRNTNMTGKECKERWRNLRSVFVRNLKPPPSGSGKKKKPYYLTEAMQFALPFIRAPTNPSGYLPRPLDEELTDNEKLEDFEEPDLSRTPTSPLFPPTSLLFPAVPPRSVSSTPTITEEALRSRLPDTSGVKKRMPPKAGTESEQAACTKRFNPKLVKIATLESEKKEYLRGFLLGLMPELQQMSEGQLQQFRRRVFMLIDDIKASTQEAYGHGLSQFQMNSSDSSSTYTIETGPTKPSNWSTSEDLYALFRNTISGQTNLEK